MSWKPCGKGSRSKLAFVYLPSRFVRPFCVCLLTFLQRERSVDSRGIQLNLGVNVAWRSFWVVLGKREIILDSIEANGNLAQVKNIVEWLLKLISAKQKPWGNKMVSPIIAFYSDSIALMLLDFARLILCTISFTKLPKECSNYGQTQNFFRPANWTKSSKG